MGVMRLATTLLSDPLHNGSTRGFSTARDCGIQLNPLSEILDPLLQLLILNTENRQY